MTWLYKCQHKGEMERFMIVHSSLIYQNKQTKKFQLLEVSELEVIRSYRNSNEEGILEPVNRIM